MKKIGWRRIKKHIGKKVNPRKLAWEDKLIINIHEGRWYMIVGKEEECFLLPEGEMPRKEILRACQSW